MSEEIQPMSVQEQIQMDYGHNLEEYAFNSIVPVHCRECGCYISEGEPDARDYYCEECDSNTGSSIIEILLF